MMEKGVLVRLKAPKNKKELEDEWYCQHWEALTPMVYLGPGGPGWGFARVMTPDEGVCMIWHEYLTTQMKRGYYGV